MLYNIYIDVARNIYAVKNVQDATMVSTTNVLTKGQYRAVMDVRRDNTPSAIHSVWFNTQDEAKAYIRKQLHKNRDMFKTYVRKTTEALGQR